MSQCNVASLRFYANVLLLKCMPHLLFPAGPFLISCDDNNLYLKVNINEAGDYLVKTTPKKEMASHFFLTTSKSGKEFSIIYINTQTKSPRYLYAPLNVLGANDGPLIMNSVADEDKTTFRLFSRRVNDFKAVDTSEWVDSNEIFYINCKTKFMRRSGYICVKKVKTPDDTYYTNTCCVPSMRHDDDHFLLFQLVRPPSDHENRITIDSTTGKLCKSLIGIMDQF